jgi:hypothetical protein
MSTQNPGLRIPSKAAWAVLLVISVVVAAAISKLVLINEPRTPTTPLTRAEANAECLRAMAEVVEKNGDVNVANEVAARCKAAQARAGGDSLTEDFLKWLDRPNWRK